MRDQQLLVPTPSGDIEVIVTAEALEVLRGGGLPFQDGASLVRHFRSFLAEIALEKLQLSEGRPEPVILTGADVAE